MKEKLNLIVSKLMAGDSTSLSWFCVNGIIVKEKGDYWVLNYHKFADKNEYNVLTRGLVVHKDKGVVSCPFFRFFNYGEPTAAKVNFANSDLMEKLDGSLVGVSFPDGMEKPIWHFRSLLSAHQQDRDFAIKGFVLNEESPLLMAVEPYLNDITFHEGLREYSLMFEFISRANAVITSYQPEQHGLYLIGARHLGTLRELSEDELDELAKKLNTRRPRRWNATSYDEIIAMMANFSKDYEGFVVRDRETGLRIKIKSEDYLKRHRLLTKLNYKNLIPLWFEGERGEIEAYFPQTSVIFDQIQKSCEEFVQKTLSVLLYWQSQNVSRKEVAFGIIGKEPRYVCPIVFKLLETAKEGQEAAIRELIKKMSIEALIEAWNLKEELVESVVDEI